MSIYISAEYADYDDNYSCVIYSNDNNLKPFMLFSLKLRMEVNQPGSLEMTLDKNHPFNKMDNQKKRIVRVFNNGNEIWRGYPIKTETDFYGNKAILCDGCLSVLKDIITEYPEGLIKYPEGDIFIYDYKVKNLINYAFSNAFKGTNYSNKITPYGINYICGNVHRDYVGDEDTLYTTGEEESRYTTLNDFLKNHLTEKFGGYIIYDFSPPGIILEPDPTPPSKAWNVGYLSSSNDYESVFFNDRNWYNYYRCCFFKTLDELHESIRRGHVKVLEKGKNIIDFKKTVDMSEIFTGVLPIGDDNKTITGTSTDRDSVVKPISENVVIDEEAAKVLGQIIRIENFSGVGQGSLKTIATSFLKNNLFKSINLEISFFDDAILSNDEYIILPGNAVCYKYGDERSGNFIYNIICHSVEIDLLNPSKSVWKTFVDNEKISSNYEEYNKVRGIYYLNSSNYNVEYNSNKDEEIT